MRVCYISRYGLGTVIKGAFFGGAEVLSFNEANELAKDKRFDVHLLVEGDEYKTFKHGKITVWIIPKSKSFKDFFITYQIFKKINADIYYKRASTRGQWAYEPLICKILRKTYIFNEVGDPAWILRRRSPISISLYKTCLTLADVLVAHSKLIQHNLKLFTKRATKQINHSTIIHKPIKTKRKHILWLGRADPFKRMDIFIELAKHFPKEKFLILIIGKMTQHLPPNIKVLYDVPNNIVNKYYASAKMVIQTSVSEGFGTVFLEAWKNKTPVVSLTVDPDGVIKEYKTGLHSGNFEQMIKDVKLLLTNKKKWKECSENGHKYVKENHDVKLIVEQYKELFLNLNSQRNYSKISAKKE